MLTIFSWIYHARENGHSSFPVLLFFVVSYFCRDGMTGIGFGLTKCVFFRSSRPNHGLNGARRRGDEAIYFVLGHAAPSRPYKPQNSLESASSKPEWIPACAGMTESEKPCLTMYLQKLTIELKRIDRHCQIRPDSLCHVLFADSGGDQGLFLIFVVNAKCK